MRRTHVILGIVICLLLAAFWYLWGSGYLAGRKEPASLVAKDVLLFAEQKRVGELIDGFNASRLGKSLAAIDIGKAAAGAGLGDEQAAKLGQAVQTAKELAVNPFVRKFCDDSLSLAFFGGTTEATISHEKRRLPLQVLLIARPQQKAELLEALSSAFTTDISKHTIAYGNREITRFTDAGTTFYATLADGFFLFAFDQPTLQRALDLTGNGGQSLADLPEYRGLRERYQEPVDFFVFTSPEAIEKELLRGRQLPAGRMTGLRYSSYGVWRDRERFRDRSVTLVDRQTLPAANSWVFANPPQDNATLALVPADVQFYYWSNSLALRVLLELLKNGDSADALRYSSLAAGFQEITGHAIEEIAASIGDGASLQVRRGAAGSLFPIPATTVFFPVKDRAPVEDAITRGIGSLGLTAREETYRNRSFRAASLGLPGDVEIVYGFLDGYLFLGSNRQMLEGIIETVEKGNGLKTSADFAPFAADFAKPGNSVTYVKVAEIIEGVREIAALAPALLAMKDGQMAERSQILADTLLNPLLAGFGMISAIGTRTYTETDRIVMESIYTITPE